MTLEDLKTAWNEYVLNEDILPSVSPLIANSWKRCRGRLSASHHIHLNKLNSTNLLTAQVSSFDLISLARPIMEDIFQNMENPDYAVVLLNAAGYILDLIATPETQDVLKKFEIEVGVGCTEHQIGTNALGLALTERQPVAVIGPEHYSIQFHPLAAVASPVFDINGRPMGVLGLITTIECYQPFSLGLAATGAKAIESQRQADHMLAEYNSQLDSLNEILDTISEGIVVWNGERVLMHYNKRARSIIDYPLDTLLGRKADGIIVYPQFIVDAVTNRQPLTDVEATITVGEQTINCFISLRFIYKKGELESIISIIRPTSEVRQLIRREVGAQAPFTVEDILGDSQAIRRVRRMVKSAASASASILIRGESGTGRNMVASAIHNESQRCEQAFLIMPLFSTPSELILEELIGYGEGSSSKRSSSRPSKFELAQGGTLYLQDVDLLPMEAQAVLLNALEMKVIQRLGSDRPIEVDVRVIASTSADMEKLVAERRFRPDLYYRLNTFSINLPALRERPSDIPRYVEAILKRLTRQFDNTLAIDPEIMEVLCKYPWPGNVRELESVLSQAAVQATSGVIELEHLPGPLRNPSIVYNEKLEAIEIQPLDEVERKAIMETGALWRGNLTQMAGALGISRTTLWRKIRKYQISLEDYHS